jgi:hypothetical protein
MLIHTNFEYVVLLSDNFLVNANHLMVSAGNNT